MSRFYPWLAKKLQPFLDFRAGRASPDPVCVEAKRLGEVARILGEMRLANVRIDEARGVGSVEGPEGWMLDILRGRVMELVKDEIGQTLWHEIQDSVWGWSKDENPKD